MSITFSDVDEILRIIERFPAAEIRFEHGGLKLYVKRTQLELQGAASAAPLSMSNTATPVDTKPQRAVPPSIAVHPPSSASLHAPPPPAPVTSGSGAGKRASGNVDRARQIPIESPLMGVFYAAPSPEAPPFVTVGQSVVKGTELCIIEVMKVMNLIKAPVDGKIVDILVENGTTVEIGQALMWVSP
jgi:acetyl-CoA carboxylase biotin carboxyl carrier protein